MGLCVQLAVSSFWRAPLDLVRGFISKVPNLRGFSTSVNIRL